jgi:uncharacterized Ntn-hydrolase superfamily protein
MTLSITARCGRTGMVGIAISSSSPAVAARCAWTAAGVGAVATQNITDPRLGALGLDLLRRGFGAPAVVAQLVTAGRFPEFRQLAVVDQDGNTASHSGARALGINGAVPGPGCIAAGNLLASAEVLPAIVAAFVAHPAEHLAERLLRALEAGAAAGGEAGPLHSAGLRVSDRHVFPICELRFDWSDTPIADLRRGWDVYAPQMGDYLQRAIDPTLAPGYGVPGDEA